MGQRGLNELAVTCAHASDFCNKQTITYPKEGKRGWPIIIFDAYEYKCNTIFITPIIAQR